MFIKSLTTGNDGDRNALIMGRKTYESIPRHRRPLANRLNVVMTRGNPEPLEKEGATVVASWDEALEAASAVAGSVFVFGGAEVYKQALASPLCAGVYLTRVDVDVPCDTFFPDLEELPYERDPWWGVEPNQERASDAWIEDDRGLLRYRFERWRRVHPEYQYLDLCREVMADGNRKGDRTGVGTLSVFGRTMRFDLSQGFPLLTTKRVFWRGVAEELLWMIRGSTDAGELAARGVHIWDANASREFLDSLGHIDRQECDLGPVSKAPHN